MDKKTVLVTGGLGYIGSHTVIELLDLGYEVLIIDDLSNSNIEILTQIELITTKAPTFYNFTLLNKLKLIEVFEKHKIDSVIHFAAHLLVDESVENPLKYYTNNIVSLLNLLDVMKSFNVFNLVFSSSCTVYGEPLKLPVSETENIKKSSSPYGTTKIMGETIIKDSCKAYGFSCIALRYFNPVGAHSTGFLGELPKGQVKHLFPVISKYISNEANTITIFGNDYDTIDGTAIRDYVHVVDLAKAHILGINRLSQEQNEKNFEFFNIGSGSGFSVLEIIKAFERASGKEIKYDIKNRRDGDVSKIWADTTKAKKVLNWEAKYTLDNMVKSSLDWEAYHSTLNW